MKDGGCSPQIIYIRRLSLTIPERTAAPRAVKALVLLLHDCFARHPKKKQAQRSNALLLLQVSGGPDRLHGP
jgi:hypothetical protein